MFSKETIGLLLQIEENDLRKMPDYQRDDLKATITAKAQPIVHISDSQRGAASVLLQVTILHSRGVPDEHIIVFMYDGISVGWIINEIGSPDVYHGVPRDYTGSAVSPQNYLWAVARSAQCARGTSPSRSPAAAPATAEALRRELASHAAVDGISERLVQSVNGAVLAAPPCQQRASNFWAVLVAGSNGYWNYRHQADVCHMYQILHSRGVPDEHIIVLMYDDIAHNKANPHNGTIINEIGGPDVYHGVPKDFTGDNVTPQNFLAILRGEKPAGGSGKHLESTTEDHVFVFFSDHGGSGSLGFPYDDLEWRDLQDALQAMHANKLYGTLVLFIEACEAGSMFYRAQLPPSCYVVTASPVMSSSYADQFSEDYHAYLTDTWSFASMHYIENAAHNAQTLQDEFDGSFAFMQNGTGSYSEPCQYGDAEIPHDFTLASFFGAASAARVRSGAQLSSGAVCAWDVTLELARRRHQSAPTAATAEALRREVAAHAAVDRIAELLVKSVNGAVLAAPPCTKCDNSCPCWTQCVRQGKDTTLCNLECCGDKGDCYMSNSGEAVRQRDQCVFELGRVLRRTCGRKHEYTASLATTFHRICRQANGRQSFDTVAATLSSECTALVV
eukprot:m51a1_g14124 hypothetical protein (617) ;mRNA; r:192536-197094